MNPRLFAVRQLALVLIALSVVITLAFAQSQTGRPLIALYEPSGQKADATLAAALGTVADSVELDLACLQRFEVRRLPAVDPVKELAKVRSYCQANRIDQAIMGSGTARSGGGYAFKLALYDRRSDSVTMVQEGSCSGALDMFDTTDTLVAALLDKLSGEHLLFGSLVVETEPAGAVVSLNGKEVGPSPLSLRGLPVGTVSVSARSPGWEEGSTTATVQDNQIVETTLTLERSVGTLSLDMPADAVVTLRAGPAEPLVFKGSGSQKVPTGSYELEASCQGLSTMKQSLTVERNSTSSWRPWTMGYLEIESDVAAATVEVDGVPQGTVPLVVEVDPGVLHRVELSKDKYEMYRAELSVAPARKVSFQPELTMKTGSIRVDSQVAGLSVRLDDGAVKETPCTFDAVTPGPHTLYAWDRMLNRRWYKVTRETKVDVLPEQQSEAALQMVSGTATLVLDDLPRSATVVVEGSPWQPGQDVPAGAFQIEVTTPSGQTWSGSDSAAIGETRHVSLDTLAALVPVRHIKVDGNVDDWAGLEPLWRGVKDKWSKYWFKNGFQMDPFPNQPGTNLAAAYICRDDKEIYIRMDFDDGAPGAYLSKDIKDTLVREFHCYVTGPKGPLSLNGGFNVSRQWTGTGLGTWDDYTKTWTPLANSLDAYAMKGSSLELAIPISRVQKLLSEGTVQVELAVADAGPTDWNNGYSTYRRPVDFFHFFK